MLILVLLAVDFGCFEEVERSGLLREDGAHHYIDVRGLMFSDHTFESRKNWEYHELVACKFLQVLC